MPARQSTKKIFARHSRQVDRPFTKPGGYYSRESTGLGESPLNLALASAAQVEVSLSTLASSLPQVLARPRIHAEAGRYGLRLAETVEDRDAACRLRFKVFNIELGEGLESSYQTGLDTDQFDLFCEHLLVEDKLSARASWARTGCSPATTAARNLGYYSEQEFNLAPYEPLRAGILELGRASIDREHRTPEVLTLLWRGIAQYATDMGLRYLIGCSSLNSKDPAEGWQMYRQLEHYRVSPEFETMPTASLRLPQRAGRRARTAAGLARNRSVANSAIKLRSRSPSC